MADLDRIQKFYIAYYGRPADTVGLEYWDGILTTNPDEGNMVKNFGSSEQPEYQNLYGTNAIADFIRLVYQNLFNRTVETDGLNYWVGVYDTAISQGQDPNLIRANMVTFIMDGAQDTATTKDATTVANKLTVAKAFTAAVDTPEEIAAYSDVTNTAGQAAARQLLQTVTSDEASVTAAIANVDSTLSVLGVDTVPTVLDITTGAGNDIYTTLYANLTAEDAIDMGAGTDSLRFADDATFNSSATQALLTNVTGVEQLGTVNALLTVDGEFVTQTSFYTDGAAGGFALTNLKDQADINFGAGAILASTAGMKSGATALNVNLSGSITGASDVSNGLTVTGSSTINVDSSGTDGQPDNELNLTAAVNQAVFVTVTGSQNLTLTTNALPTNMSFSVDASAFTGNLTATGGTAADFIVSGSGNDTLSGGAGATISDALFGDAGNDKFSIIAGATLETYDSILDFVTKADTISFGGAAGSAANYTEGTAAVADFDAALDAANAVLVGGGLKYNVQQVGSNSYLFHDIGGAGGADQAVQLVGVALTGIEFGDIVG